jgi:hypothetical protein
MRQRIRRIVNGCAAQQLVARRDLIAPEFIFKIWLSAHSTENSVSSRPDNSFKPMPLRGVA